MVVSLEEAQGEEERLEKVNDDFKTSISACICYLIVKLFIIDTNIFYIFNQKL
jgi:hypothetical protein